MADLKVNFSFSGPQGPAGDDPAVDVYSPTEIYTVGRLVRDAEVTLYISLIDDNVGNPLSDTDSWKVIAIGAGVVTQLNDLTDVTIASPAQDQVIVYDLASGVWLNEANHGGNTPVNPTQDKLTITFSPTSIVLASIGTTIVTATPSINDGFTIDNVSWVIKDQNNHEITATVDPATFVATFTADDTIRGHISASMVVSYTRTSDSSTGTDTKTGTIPVRENWFTVLSATQPTAVPDTPVGVWSSPQTASFTQDDTGRNLYIILPTDDAPYTFTGGIVTYSTTSLGVISTNYTLFRIDDYDDSQTGGGAFPLTITEV